MGTVVSSLFLIPDDASDLPKMNKLFLILGIITILVGVLVGSLAKHKDASRNA
jgi:hypothetical protein